MSKPYANNLKPCPFCGKRPILHRSTYSERYRIICDAGCGAMTSSRASAEKAIESWNRRATDEN